MSPRLPRLTAREVLSALGRAGWYRDHQRGSHVYLRHPSQSGYVTVPVHTGETIKPKTLAAILAQAGLTVEQLGDLL